ncbi:acid-sensing ion channel 5-like [Physella acuta]|uniref:acid-sensing ion channel 5-like n=1 Tax=Physella acuta TaxID=109671 RepID=UPI0027DEA66A|nr:acid-sensing ion channel 5-like [Physella acuta]
MTRKQIKPENNYPLSTMDEREALNPDSQEAGSRPASVVVANNSPAHEKKKIYEADNDDEEPVKLTNRDLLVYYAQNSTMHGVPSIVGSELYRGRHIFWMFVVCVMALFLGTVIYWQMSDYYNYPTVTSVDISYVTENDFPSVTFCDQNIMNRNEVKGLKDDLTAFYLAELTEITGIYMNQVRPIKKKMQKPAATNRSSSELVGNYLRDSLIRFKIAMSKPENQPVCSWGDYYWTPCPFVSFRVTQMGLCGTLNVRDLPRNRSDNSTEDTAVSNAMRGLTILLDVPSLEIPFRFNHIEDGGEGGFTDTFHTHAQTQAVIHMLSHMLRHMLTV